MDKNFMWQIDLLTARKIRLKQALEYMILPFYEQGDMVYYGGFDENAKGRELIEFLFKKKSELILVKKEELSHLINSILNINEKLEEDILIEAINMKASDIHFEPIKDVVHVRYRIDGNLVLVRKLLNTEYLRIISRLKVRANMDITERRKAQDGKINITIAEKSYNCRISTMPLLSGEKLVLRIIYEEKYQRLDELNFSEAQREKVKKIIEVKNGLTIINGPTGSGKTTTLYSILGEIKNDNINITTLEDPVEITMDGINQINLNPKAGITFSSGLRGILRQDPDVIMIGEIRDEETAKMAVRSSITGHKVYSTIHTKSPREVYFRLEDMGVKGYLIRSSLAGIISQRLICLICDDCKEYIGDKIINSKKVKLYKKCGCKKCNMTGIRGRTLISSVHYIDKELREKMNNIYEDESILMNEEMMDILNKLLENGKLDYEEYLKFIQGEELGEI